MPPKVITAQPDPMKAVCAVALAAVLAALSVIDPILAIASIVVSAALLAWPQRRSFSQLFVAGGERTVR